MEEKKHLKAKVLKVIEGAERPLSVEAVRVRVGVKSWHLIQSLLFGLMAEGKIAGLETSKRWVFGKLDVMKPVTLSKT